MVPLPGHIAAAHDSFQEAMSLRHERALVKVRVYLRSFALHHSPTDGTRKLANDVGVTKNSCYPQAC
eukprot:scaffold76329_cov17-Tisochrysis_lutea.AAC.1